MAAVGKGPESGGGAWPDLFRAMHPFEYLEAVAHAGSIAAAAAKLDVSPTAVRAGLGRFKEDLGYPVYVSRGRAGAEVTAQGKQLLDWFRRLSSHAQGIEAAAKSLGSHGVDEVEKPFKIAASTTTSEFLVPRWLKLLDPDDPTVSLVSTRSETAIELVRDGDCEVGFIANDKSREELWDEERLSSAPVGEDEVVIVVNREHRWAKRPIRVEELFEELHLARAEGSGALAVFKRALENAEPRQDPEKLRCKLEMNSSIALRQSVLEQEHPAALSSIAVAEQLASGELHAVKIEGLPPMRRIRRAIWKGKRAGLIDKIVRIAELNSVYVPRPFPSVEVRLRVEGDGLEAADVTWTASPDEDSVETVPLPWSKTLTANPLSDFTLAASARHTAAGRLSCSISLAPTGEGQAEQSSAVGQEDETKVG